MGSVNLAQRKRSVRPPAKRTMGGADTEMVQQSRSRSNFGIRTNSDMGSTNPIVRTTEMGEVIIPR